MISERQFVNSYSSYWKELLPLLTKSFVQVINKNNVCSLFDNIWIEFEEIPSLEGTRDVSIVSEYAFNVVCESIAQKMPILAVLRDDKTLQSAQKNAILSIERYEGRQFFPDDKLNEHELNEGADLALRYARFLELQGNDAVSMPVPLKGAGFINSCLADMTIDSYLVEIKTVKRGVTSKDIKQLFIYLALSFNMRRKKWQYCGFFNPRRGVFYKFNTEEFIQAMSGGKSTVDTFSDFIEFVCSPEALLDSKF